MAKKLFIVWFLISMIIFSSISIYANQERSEKPQTHRENVAQAEPEAIATAMAEEQTAVRKEDEGYLKGLSAYIRHVNRNVSVEEADSMVRSFVESAKTYDVDEKIVMAVAQNESTYYADAVSCADFKGLMQTGDGIAKNAGYNPGQLFEPSVSIEVGAEYLSDKLKEFGDMRLALTAYNQGSGSVLSGNYTTGYADLAMERAAAMERFLVENGYVKEPIS